MAIIDRSRMLLDLKEYLPDASALSDTLLNNIINNIIDFQIPVGEIVPIDDDKFYSEDLCKALKAAALLNKGKFAVDSSTFKREKVDDVEIERFESAARFAWDDFVKSLPDICPYLPEGGFTPARSIGIVINPSSRLVIDNCLPIVSTLATDNTQLYF